MWPIFLNLQDKMDKAVGYLESYAANRDKFWADELHKQWRLSDLKLKRKSFVNRKEHFTKEGMKHLDSSELAKFNTKATL